MTRKQPLCYKTQQQVNKARYAAQSLEQKQAAVAKKKLARLLDKLPQQLDKVNKCGVELDERTRQKLQQATDMVHDLVTNRASKVHGEVQDVSKRPHNADAQNSQHVAGAGLGAEDLQSPSTQDSYDDALPVFLVWADEVVCALWLNPPKHGSVADSEAVPSFKWTDEAFVPVASAAMSGPELAAQTQCPVELWAQHFRLGVEWGSAAVGSSIQEALSQNVSTQPAECDHVSTQSPECGHASTQSPECNLSSTQPAGCRQSARLLGRKQIAS